jgi:hypothetical protein
VGLAHPGGIKGEKELEGISAPAAGLPLFWYGRRLFPGRGFGFFHTSLIIKAKRNPCL